jgi:hypothetical protein
MRAALLSFRLGRTCSGEYRISNWQGIGGWQEIDRRRGPSASALGIGQDWHNMCARTRTQGMDEKIQAARKQRINNGACTAEKRRRLHKSKARVFARARERRSTKNEPSHEPSSATYCPPVVRVCIDYVTRIVDIVSRDYCRSCCMRAGLAASARIHPATLCHANVTRGPRKNTRVRAWMKRIGGNAAE